MRKYTETHEWIDLKGDTATIGITRQGIQEIGGVAYVEFPKVGLELERGQDACVIESTKAAIDIQAPLSGTVCAVNTQLKDEIAKINNSPEEQGWLFQIKLQDKSEMNLLLEKSSYESLIGG